MRLLILLVALSILTGCDARVYRWELDGYERQCKDHGGIYLVDNLYSSARCVDGTWIIKALDEEK